MNYQESLKRLEQEVRLQWIKNGINALEENKIVLWFILIQQIYFFQYLHAGRYIQKIISYLSSWHF